MAYTYTQLTINSTDEVLIAMLSLDFPFESFEEREQETLAYIKSDLLNEEIREQIDFLIKDSGASCVWEELEDRNWNEIWESNFHPVEVDGVCRIRAEFHEPSEGFLHEIIIQPKMAFGTGHHQTTYMMIKQMSKINFNNKSVFDYGCGTGILAIYASMLGGNPIDAVDIEEESCLNTKENAERNGINNITVFEGDIKVCPDITYDIILANINRNILMQSVEELAKKSKEDTLLLVSGILDVDEEIIRDSYEKNGFKFIENTQRDQWSMLMFQFQGQ